MLEFHHTGLLVKSIDISLKSYSVLFGASNISTIFDIDSQKVRVCFIQTGPSSYLELVEPIGESSSLAKLLKKGINYYHIGYKVDDLEVAVIKLENFNYKALPPFKSEAFDGKLCVFLFSPDEYLIELIEK
jgi:methylmalonyl-CoA/ethylmalonyl-CoA epimerase